MHLTEKLLVKIPSTSHMKALLVRSAHLWIWEDTSSHFQTAHKVPQVSFAGRNYTF